MRLSTVMLKVAAAGIATMAATSAFAQQALEIIGLRKVPAQGRQQSQAKNNLLDGGALNAHGG